MVAVKLLRSQRSTRTSNKDPSRRFATNGCEGPDVYRGINAGPYGSARASGGSSAARTKLTLPNRVVNDKGRCRQLRADGDGGHFKGSRLRSRFRSGH
jgi:hypothetical protein